MLIVRAIALSLALLVSLGVIIPIATNYSEAGPRHHSKKKKKIKKYSKAWWKWYRAKKRKQKAIAARKRSLRLRQMQLAKQRETGEGDQVGKTETAKSSRSLKSVQKQEDSTPALLPSGDVAPKGWKKNQATQGELQFRVDDDNGKTIGTASIGVVGPAVGADTNAGRVKTVGGVQTSALRRTVIDRMMKEQGWVVNDYQKEVGGKKVYVVVAQAPGASGRVQSRLFYFTEVEGRIYSLTTNAADDSVNERIAEESEKVINSLQRTNRPVQQAGLRQE